MPTAPGTIQPAPINNCNQNVNTNNIVVNAGFQGDSDKLLLITKQKLNSRLWTTSLCGCLNNLTNCLCGVFFLPCLMCKVANRLGECACITWLPGGFVSLRTKLRTMGGIKGSI